MINYAITPIALGAGVGMVSVDYPIKGKVLRVTMDQATSMIVLWVSHEVGATMLRKSFVIAQAANLITDDCTFEGAVEFAIRVPQSQMLIANPNQPTQKDQIINMIVFVFSTTVADIQGKDNAINQ